MFSTSYEYLSKIIITSGYDIDKIRTLLKNKFANLETNNLNEVIQEIQHHLLYQVKKKWQDSQRKADRLKKKLVEERT